MFFRTEACLKKFKALQAVNGGRTADLKDSDQSVSCPDSGRTSRWIPGKKGSMTVEAALVFPFFLLVVTAFLYLLVMVQLKTEIGRSLTDTGKQLAELAVYSDTTGSIGSSAAVILYEKQELKEYLEGRAATAVLRDGTDGISTLGSSWDRDKSLITLQASGQALFPPGLTWFHPVAIRQKRVVRGWTGFGGREDSGNSEKADLVYVTDYGTVYHRDLGCRYLKLSIHQKELSRVDSLRNHSGGKYYPCEKCWKEGADRVFLTDDGTRYHQSLNCSALIRGIHTVPLSETVLPPCSVCGG